jgi:hypothetical protein
MSQGAFPGAAYFPIIRDFFDSFLPRCLSPQPNHLNAGFTIRETLCIQLFAASWPGPACGWAFLG